MNWKLCSRLSVFDLTFILRTCTPEQPHDPEQLRPPHPCPPEWPLQGQLTAWQRHSLLGKSNSRCVKQIPEVGRKLKHGNETLVRQCQDHLITPTMARNGKQMGSPTAYPIPSCSPHRSLYAQPSGCPGPKHDPHPRSTPKRRLYPLGHEPSSPQFFGAPIGMFISFAQPCTSNKSHS